MTDEEIDKKAQKIASRVMILIGFIFMMGCPILFIWTFFGGVAAGLIGYALIQSGIDLLKEKKSADTIKAKAKVDLFN